jgi:DNA-binding NarL/FixJ family response regulator
MSALPPDGETPLRVVLVDDHAVVRTGYRRLLELEPGIVVIAEFDDGDRAYAWLCGHPADVLVLDLSMPGRGGLATLRRVHQRLPALRVLVFSMHEHPALAMQALRAGACGYLTKSSPPESLVDAVRAVTRGERPLSPEIRAGLGDMLPGHGSPHEQLSPREFEIFLALARGDSVEAIARQFSLSSKTVSNYQTLVRQKVGLGSALEMHQYALSRGLLAGLPPMAAA